MKTIRFLTSCAVKDAREHTAQAERYEAGAVVTLTDESAQHWLRRGKAEECEPIREPQPPGEEPTWRADLRTAMAAAPLPEATVGEMASLEESLLPQLEVIKEAEQPRRGRPRKE